MHEVLHFIWQRLVLMFKFVAHNHDADLGRLLSGIVEWQDAVFEGRLQQQIPVLITVIGCRHAQ